MIKIWELSTTEKIVLGKIVKTINSFYLCVYKVGILLLSWHMKCFSLWYYILWKLIFSFFFSNFKWNGWKLFFLLLFFKNTCVCSLFLPGWTKTDACKSHSTMNMNSLLLNVPWRNILISARDSRNIWFSLQTKI